MKWVCFLLTFFVFDIAYSQAVIERVLFSGTKRSKADYLMRFIESRKGADFSQQTVEEDKQALRNLMIFSMVEDSVYEGKEGKIVQFKLKELFTTIPYVDFGGVEGNRYLQVGLVDYHWLGRGIHFGGYYRYDTRHSFQLYQIWPYIQNSKWGLSASLLRYATIEPLFFNGEHANYNYQNLTFEVLGRYEFSFRHFIQFGGGILDESFEIRPDGNGAIPGVPERDSFDKWIIKSAHTLDRRNYHNHILSGWSNHFLFESVINARSIDPFWKLLNESRYFGRIGKNGNLGLRLRLGLSPNNGSPFVPFVQDSYVNIRGSGNRVARGAKEAVLNTEYRHTAAYKDGFFAAQWVAFIDLGSWEFARGQSFGSDPYAIFYGLGARVQIFKAYNFILRVDYGINARDKNKSGWVLGVGQYF